MTTWDSSWLTLAFICRNSYKFDAQIDGLTDQWMNRPSDRDARMYSRGRGKTGKTDAPIENELDIVRNWNFIRLVILAYFFARESFKLICIFYDFEAPPFENR